MGHLAHPIVLQPSLPEWASPVRATTLSALLVGLEMEFSRGLGGLNKNKIHTEEEKIKEKGEEKINNPFGRKDKLHRSPTRPRSNSMESAMGPCHTPTIGKPKRKRQEEEEEEEPEVVVCDRKIITKISSMIQKLKEFIPPNTKAELKRGIEEISLCLKFLEIEDDAKLKKRAPGKEMTERSTQTQAYKTQLEHAANKDLWGELEKEKSVEVFKNLTRRKWPKTAYRKVKTKRGNALQDSTGKGVAFFSTGAEDKSNLRRYLKKMYPTLIDAEAPESGCVTQYVEAGTLTVPGKQNKFDQKYMFKLTPNLEEQERKLDAIYLCLSELSAAATKAGIKKLNIVPARNLDMDILKLAAEYIFHDSGIEVTLYIADEHKQIAATKNARPKLRETDAIILKTEDRSYAEVLREVKQKVRPEETNTKIRDVRKTRDGRILLAVEKGPGTGKLKQQIEKEIAGITITESKNRQTTIHVLDMDAVTSKEEIEEALLQQFEIQAKDFSVKSLRPTAIGKQIATIAANRETAQKFLHKGKVKIGWLVCRMRERIYLQKCYRCLEYGHKKQSCVGPSRETICFKCGQEGHKEKSCTNSEYCWVCNKKDHKYGTLKCPEYKEKISEKIKARKKSSKSEESNSSRKISESELLNQPISING